MSAIGHLAVLLLLLAACSLPAVPQPTSDGGPATHSIHAHAHNDYQNDRPLLDALDLGFQSVEADVWSHDGDIGVSHGGIEFAGTLRALYLDPLQARVDADGSVHGDGQPFFLWVDLKESDPLLLDQLAGQLDVYPMLSTFDDSGETPGPVTVVLTGTHAAKVALAELPGPRPFVRDSNAYSIDDPPADQRWRYYALPFAGYIDWTGLGPIGEAQLLRLRGLIDSAHAKGRQLRFYAAPDLETYWELARYHGVDFIGTDRIGDLAAFLSR